MRLVNRLYAFFGWAIVALGGLHMLATIRLSASPPAFRIWFFGSGLAMALGGALNLLNRAYGRTALGLRIVCWIANTLLLLFAAVAGVVTEASVPENILIMGLLNGVFISSLSSSSLNRPHDPEGT